MRFAWRRLLSITLLHPALFLFFILRSYGFQHGRSLPHSYSLPGGQFSDPTGPDALLSEPISGDKHAGTSARARHLLDITDELKDAYPELVQYLKRMEQQPQVDCDEAVRRQAWPSAESLGLQPWDTMRELDTLPARIAFLNQLTSEVCSNATAAPGYGSSPRVGSFLMWGGDMWGLRRTLLPFLQWHTQLGICRFYVAYPGRDRAVVAALRQISSVRLIFNQPPFARKAVAARWRRYVSNDEWGQRPGNWRQMCKQVFTGDLAVARAKAEGLQWLLHIDADEMLLPSTNLAADLAASPPWAAALTLYNHEAVVEAADVINKYEQVTLFKSHAHFTPPKAVDLQWRFLQGDHGAFFQVYDNGKAMARADRGYLQVWGVHTFFGAGHPSFTDPVHNPTGRFMAAPSSRLAVLHLSYTNWHDAVGKAARACPAEYRAAVLANDTAKVKECFVLEFDMEAYMAAVRGEEQARAFWTRNALFSEGAVRKDGQGCRVYRDVPRLADMLVRDGLMRRVTAVQQVLRAHEAAIRAVARDMGIRVEAGSGAGAGGPLTTTV